MVAGADVTPGWKLEDADDSGRFGFVKPGVEYPNPPRDDPKVDVASGVLKDDRLPIDTFGLK